MATAINQVAYITSAAYGTNPLLKNLTFHYNSLSTSAETTPTVAGPVTGGDTPNPSGVGLPSLKTKLAGGGRLDSCLAEGKNYIRVTAMDNARSNWDGVSYTPNSSSFSYESYSKFIKIDNTGARIGLSGEAAKVFESNAPLGAFAGGGVTLSPFWKNYTITGSIKSTDPFGNDDTTNALPACSPYTSTGQTCAVNGSGVPKPNAAGVIWKAPQGVNPSNGTFTAIKCGNLESLPRMSACDWGCADGYSYDSVTNSCLTTVVTPVCKADGTAPCIAGLPLRR